MLQQTLGAILVFVPMIYLVYKFDVLTHLKKGDSYEQMDKFVIRTTSGEIRMSNAHTCLNSYKDEITTIKQQIFPSYVRCFGIDVFELAKEHKAPLKIFLNKDGGIEIEYEYKGKVKLLD